jgi:S-adenosylmethionine:tRNA-ribosyltransferase-isomerase (queuine synthetase)
VGTPSPYKGKFNSIESGQSTAKGAVIGIVISQARPFQVSEHLIYAFHLPVNTILAQKVSREARF